jgi:hypothetical protein
MPDLPDNEVKKIWARSCLKSPQFDNPDMISLTEIAEEQGLDVSALPLTLTDTIIIQVTPLLRKMFPPIR